MHGKPTKPALLLTDPDELRALIVDDEVNAVRPIIEQSTKPPKLIANRGEMAEILGWSIAKLDRRTRENAIPSMLDGDRRSYVISDVIEAIKAGTPAAEAKAAERQAAKQAAKRQGAADA